MLNIPENIRHAALVLGVLILSWITLRSKKIFIRKLNQKRLEGKAVLDAFTVQILEKVLTIGICFIAIMLILQILGIDVVPLLTFSGIGAAVLGFASKDVVANFFGGMMIYITRPFLANDFIEIPGKNVTGTVEEIGWYLTTIRNMQKKSLYIPNSTFSTELVLNYSRMTHRRIEEQVRFRITDSEKAQSLLQDTRQILQEHPDIDQKEQMDVFLLSISPYGMVMDIRGYTRTTNYLKFMKIKEDILLKIFEKARLFQAEPFS